MRNEMPFLWMAVCSTVAWILRWSIIMGYPFSRVFDELMEKKRLREMDVKWPAGLAKRLGRIADAIGKNWSLFYGP
jgi:hypothetical protein